MKLARVGNKSSHGRKCYASGGRVEEDISDPGSLPIMSGGMKDDMGGIDGGRAKPRLDRASKKASPVSVNVIVTSSKPDTGATPLPNAGPPMPPPAMGPPAGGPPPMPMRASGGRVNRADGGSVNSTGVGRKKEERSEDSYVEPRHSKVLTAVSDVKRLFKGKDANNRAQNSITGVQAQKMTDREKRGYKDGGRVNKWMDAGAGSGEGRLEKAKAYGDKPAKGK